MQPWIYFLLIGLVFFLMMRGGCGGHVSGHGHHRHRDDGRGVTPQGSVPTASPAQARDPVCGMTVDTSAAKVSMYQRVMYYFCSEQCRSKFEAAPDSYVSGNPQPMEHGHG